MGAAERTLLLYAFTVLLAVVVIVSIFRAYKRAVDKKRCEHGVVDGVKGKCPVCKQKVRDAIDAEILRHGREIEAKKMWIPKMQIL